MCTELYNNVHLFNIGSSLLLFGQHTIILHDQIVYIDIYKYEKYFFFLYQQVYVLLLFWLLTLLLYYLLCQSSLYMYRVLLAATLKDCCCVLFAFWAHLKCHCLFFLLWRRFLRRRYIKIFKFNNISLRVMCKTSHLFISLYMRSDFNLYFA